MNEHSDPIEFLIEFAWANGADIFVVNNAKDHLKQLREDNQRWLSCEQELSSLKKSLDSPVAWGRINGRGDLYDLRTCYNPYNAHMNETEIVPLYSNKAEFRHFYDKFQKKV